MSMLEDALRRFDLLCSLGEPTDSTIQRVVSEYPVLEASPKLPEACKEAYELLRRRYSAQELQDIEAASATWERCTSHQAPRAPHQGAEGPGGDGKAHFQNRIRKPLEDLESVLLTPTFADPSGEVSINGSKEDKAIIKDALNALREFAFEKS